MSKVSVFKQGSNYYTRIMVQGKRIKRCLNTTDKTVALRRAKKLKAEMQAGLWDKVDETKARRTAASLERIKETYEKAGKSRYQRYQKPSPATLRQNLNALRRIAGDIDGRSSTILTKKLLVDYCEKMTADKKGGELERSRRTAASTVRQARAVFAMWAREAFEDAGLELPASLFTEFMKAQPIKATKPKYRVPLDHPELVKKTIKAGRDLADKDPLLHLVFLLSYELALRANEAAHLRWSWFHEQNAGMTLGVIRRPEEWEGPKGTERYVPVHASTFAAIQEHRNESDYVLPGTMTDRVNLVERKFSAWMRSIGWDRKIFPKTSHELRKLQGSRWFTEVSPQAAQEWLGHADISTTCKHYAALSTQPAPLKPECI
jgi:integrase